MTLRESGRNGTGVRIKPLYRVRYAQCWEDPRTLKRALRITSDDDVVSITSAGDNSLALLLENPRSLTMVDMNPAQNFLAELKIRAIQHLEFDAFVGFVGASACADRRLLYGELRETLSTAARRFWDTHLSSIDRGVIHCGKFENYFRIFRRVVLPWIHREPTVRRLLDCVTLREQRLLYDEVWNTRAWRGLFRIFFGRFLLGNLGRDPSYFRYVESGDVAGDLLQRVGRGLAEIPVADNFFLEYMLTGAWADPENTHPYLAEANFAFLKENVGRIKIATESLGGHLDGLRPGSVSKLNLSDILEYMSGEEVRNLFAAIRRVCRTGSRFAYWSLFTSHEVPAAALSGLQGCTKTSTHLFSSDRTFFYRKFDVGRIVDGDGPESTDDPSGPSERIKSASTLGRVWPHSDFPA